MPSACCTPRSSVSESRPPLIKNSSHVHRLQPRQTRTFELQKNKYFNVSSAQGTKPDGLVQPPENPPQLFPSSGAERVSQHLYLGSPAARKEMREMPGCPLTSSSRTLNQFLNWVSCQVMEQALLYQLYALFQTVMWMCGDVWTVLQRQQGADHPRSLHPLCTEVLKDGADCTGIGQEHDKGPQGSQGSPRIPLLPLSEHHDPKSSGQQACVTTFPCGFLNSCYSYNAS